MSYNLNTKHLFELKKKKAKFKTQQLHKALEEKKNGSQKRKYNA